MIFEKNISELRQTDSKLADIIINWSGTSNVEVVNTKINMPSLRVNNISLHSLYDPVKEAKAWAGYYAREIDKAESICVFGFGLGYHLLELCRITDKPVMVFEPRIDVLRKALEAVDLTAALSRIRIITDCRSPAVQNNYAVFHHKPSVSLSHEYFAGAEARLRSREAIGKGLRIIVVGPIYGGSLPVAGYCSSSLIKMGHTVELIDNSRFEDALFFAKDISGNTPRYNRLISHLSSFISETVTARCEAFKPDLVLALAQAPLTADCLEALHRQKVTTAYWFVEDFRFMEYWKKIAGHYDYFFTIQKGQFFTELERAGVKNYHYLPMAACPDIHKPVELSDDEKGYYGSDLSFVGAGYYNRRHFFKGLLDLDFKIWGSDWDMHSELARCIQRSGARIDTDEIVKIFNAAKININLHSSTYLKGINPYGDFINPRTFEIMACGGFQLADRRPALEGLFEVDDELIVFDDLSDLRSKTAYYLDHPDERREAMERGRLRVLREHTYENRMKEMLEVIAEMGLRQPLWIQDGEDVEGLVKEAGGDTGLGRYLSHFSEKKRVDLSGIIKDISGGEGDISREERMFMLMNEFVR